MWVWVWVRGVGVGVSVGVDVSLFALGAGFGCASECECECVGKCGGCQWVWVCGSVVVYDCFWSLFRVDSGVGWAVPV
jgi:hypothetical protein